MIMMTILCPTEYLYETVLSPDDEDAPPWVIEYEIYLKARNWRKTLLRRKKQRGEKIPPWLFLNYD
jgi:hypothetical protein